MITHDFVVSQRVRFKVGETIRARWDDEDIVGLDHVHTNGSRTPLPGFIARSPPQDPRTKMPLSVDGVQLWYGWMNHADFPSEASR